MGSLVGGERAATSRSLKRIVKSHNACCVETRFICVGNWRARDHRGETRATENGTPLPMKLACPTSVIGGKADSTGPLADVR